MAGKSGSAIGGSGNGHASVPRSSASTSPVATRSNAASEIFVRLLLTLLTSKYRRENVDSNVKFNVEVLNQFLVSVSNGDFCNTGDFGDFPLRAALSTQH